MTPEAIAYGAVGAGALCSASWLVEAAKNRWAAFLDAKVTERYGATHSRVTPELIARIVHAEFQDDIHEIRQRLMGLERAAGGGEEAPPVQYVYDESIKETVASFVSAADRPENLPPPAPVKFNVVVGAKVGQRGDVTIDERLVASRLLITAASGAGKSWALRRLIEQTRNAVPHLIIDPEGEFHTLADVGLKVVECSSGHVAGAADLVYDWLENRSRSVVFDISELTPESRISFVGNFLTALVNLSKDLWSPVAVVIDEVHLFAPQAANVASSKPLKDLLARGRKRGQFAVIATQRVSKLSKDVVAECLNYMVGKSTLDLDVRRGLDVLGLPGSADDRIRNLDVGQFFCHGPAFGGGPVQLCKVGGVETTHPKIGGGGA